VNAAARLSRQAFRADIAHCLSDPGGFGPGVRWLPDSLLLVENGVVVGVEDARPTLPNLSSDWLVHDYAGKIIVPGFVDAHIHYVQTDIIGSFGEQLLEWLDKYTFPAERKFEDFAHAERTARFFIKELLKNGTTSALVLGSVHAQSADAIFSAADAVGMRMVAGKVLMDRNCPAYLRDSPQQGYQESKRLIEQWHGRSRLGYAITPRFAPTSSEAQLRAAARLGVEFPDTHIHTHLAENEAEVAWVKALFPGTRSYLDVYDQMGLLRERSVFAHAIYVDEMDMTRLSDTGASLVFCPSSNMFIGSGLFDVARGLEGDQHLALGSDVGGGSTFSMLQVASEAYKVAQLRNFVLTPARLLYLATLSGAQALSLDGKIGNFMAGKEADFVVLDPDCTAVLKRRTQEANLADKLFALFVLGDDRAAKATYLMGDLVYDRDFR
jgi:guanine deaminase